jgi:hypothetical protein
MALQKYNKMFIKEKKTNQNELKNKTVFGGGAVSMGQNR